MNKNLWIIVAIVATSSLVLDTNEIEAQGCRHHDGSYLQRIQHVSDPVNRVYLSATPGYRVATYSPHATYSPSYGNINGYRYPSQSGYRSR
ncbi:hypothetical protein SV7mr_30330 [Stieleria bergensis]|uniref:Uncharacterized protein n=1 Tax=Stieleria bergensis TaxID=2528025 RepID=A0A517SWL0_9BACT|nr:hypothetical protein SV7mr_30330 [Planctomycetes bacterium SV_7m_r]